MKGNSCLFFSSCVICFYWLIVRLVLVGLW